MRRLCSPVAAGRDGVEGLCQGRSRRVSVCQGLAGRTAAERADFGPDYQSPSRASLRPWRRARLTRDTLGEAAFPSPRQSDEVTSLVRALALHGVALRVPKAQCLEDSVSRKTRGMRSHLASPL